MRSGRDSPNFGWLPDNKSKAVETSTAIEVFRSVNTNYLLVISKNLIGGPPSITSENSTNFTATFVLENKVWCIISIHSTFDLFNLVVKSFLFKIVSVLSLTQEEGRLFTVW